MIDGVGVCGDVKDGVFGEGGGFVARRGLARREGRVLTRGMGDVCEYVC